MGWDISRIADESGSANEADWLSPGRCIYCDERCEANMNWHHYCHLEYENEKRIGSCRPNKGRPTLVDIED